jgi:ATP-dependent RNA helicase DHX57
VRAYDAWSQAKLMGSRHERQFCQDNFLSNISLRTISDLRQQFRDVLVDAGFALSARDVRRAAADPCNVNSQNFRLVRAVIGAGLYPNVVRVQKPDAQYVETAGGSMAKNAAAREYKYFTRPDGRVFMHPSSLNFTENEWLSPWLVYHDKQATSKVFIRDSTMVTPYALALFGGDINVLYHKGEVHIDDWVRLAAPARLGVMVRGLRNLLRQAVAEKLSNPTADISAHPAVAVLLQILAFE